MSLALALGATAIKFIMAVLANLRLPEADTLPIHFDARLRSTRSAPRLISLLVVPLITAPLLIFIAVLAPENSDSESSLLISAGLIVAAHLFHIYLIMRYLKQHS